MFFLCEGDFIVDVNEFELIRSLVVIFGLTLLNGPDEPDNLFFLFPALDED